MKTILIKLKKGQELDINGLCCDLGMCVSDLIIQKNDASHDFFITNYSKTHKIVVLYL